MDTPPDNNGPEQSPSTAQSVLQTAQLLYPAVLLLAFIVSAGVHTIVTSRTEEELVVPTVKGPGGKPLPITKRKREQEARQVDDSDVEGGGGLAKTAFLYLTAAAILSFVANGAAVALHAIQSGRESNFEKPWWCGEEQVVSLRPCHCLRSVRGLHDPAMPED